MRSHFLRAAVACFVFLIINNHVNGLPTHSQNKDVAPEDKEGVAKSPYGHTDGDIEATLM
ncbi:hypothetical protein H0H93_003199, partial [Arthromyces matolae]